MTSDRPLGESRIVLRIYDARFLEETLSVRLSLVTSDRALGGSRRPKG